MDAFLTMTFKALANAASIDAASSSSITTLKNNRWPIMRNVPRQTMGFLRIVWLHERGEDDEKRNGVVVRRAIRKVRLTFLFPSYSLV
jgi:hypothetical protein